MIDTPSVNFVRKHEETQKVLIATMQEVIDMQADKIARLQRQAKALWDRNEKLMLKVVEAGD